LDILQKNEYLGKVLVDEKTKGRSMTVELLNRINGCGAVKPRFNVKYDKIEKFEQRYLPAKGFGILVLSTSKGLITNAEAKEKKLGGRVIAYCY